MSPETWFFKHQISHNIPNTNIEESFEKFVIRLMQIKYEELIERQLFE